MSLEEDLLRDLDSDSDSSNDYGILSGVASLEDGDGDISMGNKVLDEVPLDQIELDKIQDLAKSSQLSIKLEPIIQQIDIYMDKLISKKDESDFLLSVNDLAVEITNEIEIIHNYIKLHYGKRFLELESLIPNPIEYSKVVKILGNSLEINDGDLAFISKEKILVLTMSSLQAKEETKLLASDELDSIFKSCDLLLKHEESKIKINQYISSRLAVFAPNVSAIVGPSTAAQFLNIVGGINGLATAQPRNIPSMGNKRTIGLGFGNNGVRHEGYLFYSDIIQQTSPSLRVQAMRKVSAKLVLAARFDIHSSSPDGSYGLKLRKELNEAIEKLEEPPEVQAIKALPIPKDRPAKKRAGRKLRKLKQRYESSDFRKLQNRVEFGKKESTIMDTYGEEIGLGMTSSIGNVKLNQNTRAKLSKSMKNRLEMSKASDDLFNNDLINLKGK